MIINREKMMENIQTEKYREVYVFMGQRVGLAGSQSRVVLTTENRRSADQNVPPALPFYCISTPAGGDGLMCSFGNSVHSVNEIFALSRRCTDKISKEFNLRGKKNIWICGY